MGADNPHKEKTKTRCMNWNERLGYSIQDASNSLSDWVGNHAFSLWLVGSIISTIFLLLISKTLNPIDIILLIIGGATCSWMLSVPLFALLGLMNMIGYAMIKPLSALLRLGVFSLAFGVLYGAAWWLTRRGVDGDTKVKSSLYDSLDRESNIAPKGMCFICTGGYSKRYHRDEFCRGLDSCKGELDLVSEEEAEEEDRTPCQLCY